MKKILLITICFFLTSIGAASASVILSLETPSSVVEPCTYFNVDLVVSGVESELFPAVGDFDIDVLYDPTLMAFSDYTLGPWLGDLTALEALDFSFGDPGATGAIDLAEVSLLDPIDLELLQPDTFILATLEFHCLGAGTSSIWIDDSEPLLTYKVGDALGFQLDVTIGDSLTITQTPEPSTMLLFAMGLIGFGALRRKL